VQPVIFETKPGTVFALFRSQGCGVLAQAVSTDYGHTWPVFADSSSVPNPGAGVDGIAMRGGPNLGLLLAFNNSTQTRTPLSLAYSPDQGSSWVGLGDIETNPNGSFAYPFVLQSTVDPNTVHLCYTYNVGSFNTIAYAKLTWE
jgi:predicted neuraminidase